MYFDYPTVRCTYHVFIYICTVYLYTVLLIMPLRQRFHLILFVGRRITLHMCSLFVLNAIKHLYIHNNGSRSAALYII